MPPTVEKDPMADSNETVPTPQGPVILIVDDNRAVTRSLAKLFQTNGYSPVQFNTGLGALAYAQDNKPAAAVIDIHLPDLSGLVLTSRLREKLGEQTPIIILSGDNSLATLNSLPHVGATYFFAKPVNPPMLLDRLKELMA
jgi:DNA-binding response OmpR family regulator